ncbi:maintenance of mitochondrial structure and function-domain-containing protein [Suillus placidus]|uniref:COP9 signalosome complex subunit 6 n=1 Tax=Suillus placidus TaxID=48579 RepID=A0A9P7D976_9AGAM|nr:maintenance of mitochondrial structure and function-domain-containing protein [Suillus placidus]
MTTHMDTDEHSIVLPSSTTSGLSLSLLVYFLSDIVNNVDVVLQASPADPEYFRTFDETKASDSIQFTFRRTQNGREVEIVNTFELATEEGHDDLVDHDFLVSRRDQWYCSTPLLLVLQPSTITSSSSDITGQTLPFKAYEPTIEIRDKKTRSVFIEVPYKVETGEAERIAVDWTAKGGGGSTSLESHLQAQRAAVKMLHERILVLVQYVTNVIAGQVPTDYTTLRSLSALIASLPASENKGFRDEFNTEYEDVQLTAVLSSLTKSTNILNDLVDKHLVLTGGSRDDRTLPVRRRGMGRQGMMTGDWAMHT